MDDTFIKLNLVVVSLCDINKSNSHSRLKVELVTSKYGSVENMLKITVWSTLPFKMKENYSITPNNLKCVPLTDLKPDIK